MKVLPLLFLLVVLVAAALLGGLQRGRAGVTELLMALSMGAGVTAGLALPRFWKGPAGEALLGAGGRFAAFLLMALFAAVEAYAVGAGIGHGAPAAAAALLGAPVVLAAVALRSAVRMAGEDADSERSEEAEESGRPGSGGRQIRDEERP